MHTECAWLGWVKENHSWEYQISMLLPKVHPNNIEFSNALTYVRSLWNDQAPTSGISGAWVSSMLRSQHFLHSFSFSHAALPMMGFKRIMNSPLISSATVIPC